VSNDHLVAKAKWAFTRLRHAVAFALNGSENHQDWLHRHYAAIAWLAAQTSKRVGSPRSRLRTDRCNNALHHYDRIPGLDGQLCTGQPSRSNAVSKSATQTAITETGLLRVRLVVASFGALIVGFLAATITPERGKEHVEVPPNALVRADQTAPLPANSPRTVEGARPDSASGFTVLAGTPAAHRVSPPGATIAEMISITRPLTETGKGADATAEVTLPTRKPKSFTNSQPKRALTNQKHQLTLWERLPWPR
jgi:hypothetical protein